MLAGMPNPRRYTDNQLAEALLTSTSWRGVLTKLGKSPSGHTKWIKIHADRIGLDYSHILSHMDAVGAPPTLFKNPAVMSSRAGLSIACRWFLDRGYNVSIPLEQAAYDLIAESDAGLQRVQVKTTSRQASNGRYLAGIARKIYNAELVSNASGRRREMPYSPEDVDLFFIATAAGDNYLIPVTSVVGQVGLALGPRYAEFVV